MSDALGLGKRGCCLDGLILCLIRAMIVLRPFAVRAEPAGSTGRGDPGCAIDHIIMAVDDVSAVGGQIFGTGTIRFFWGW